MRSAHAAILLVSLALAGATPAVEPAAAEPAAADIPLGAPADRSLRYEVDHAIDRGLLWLQEHQDPQGHWSDPGHPALTALVLTAFAGRPFAEGVDAHPPHVRRGYAYLESRARPDGGIYDEGLANYNTAISLMALLASGDPDYDPLIRRARGFLVGLQSDFGERGTSDDPFDGGVGYGERYEHSDLSNTTFALEALYYTRYLEADRDAPPGATRKLDWSAALRFVERCQNLPEVNDQPWASDDPANRGGFVYFPGESKAGETTLPSGRTALRSYGSISYAGLLSYAYADLERDDPRVLAVLDWLRRNYTLDENPGMGPQGLFFYYHTMAKALATYDVDALRLADGAEADWRHDLALKLLDLQTGDGHWVNENGRWWERDPVLVTAYATLTLEWIVRGL